MKMTSCCHSSYTLLLRNLPHQPLQAQPQVQHSSHYPLGDQTVSDWYSAFIKYETEEGAEGLQTD